MTTPSGVTIKLDLRIGPQLSREGVCNLKNSKNHIEPSHTSFSVHSTHTLTQNHCNIDKGIMVNKETGVLSSEYKHPFPQNTKQIHKGGIKSNIKQNELNEPNVNANVSQTLGESSGHLKLSTLGNVVSLPMSSAGSTIIRLLGYGFYEDMSLKNHMRTN
jgi:hypothetical protein